MRGARCCDGRPVTGRTSPCAAGAGPNTSVTGRSPRAGRCWSGTLTAGTAPPASPRSTACGTGSAPAASEDIADLLQRPQSTTCGTRGAFQADAEGALGRRAKRSAAVNSNGPPGAHPGPRAPGPRRRPSFSHRHEHGQQPERWSRRGGVPAAGRPFPEQPQRGAGSTGPRAPGPAPAPPRAPFHPRGCGAPGPRDERVRSRGRP